jgi:hypothetical protein
MLGLSRGWRGARRTAGQWLPSRAREGTCAPSTDGSGGQSLILAFANQQLGHFGSLDNAMLDNSVLFYVGWCCLSQSNRVDSNCSV